MAEFIIINHREKMAKNFDKALVSLLNKKFIIKFIYSEQATKFCEISTENLSYVVPFKSTVEILQNFVVFSEYMDFKNEVFRLFLATLI